MIFGIKKKKEKKRKKKKERKKRKGDEVCTKIGPGLTTGSGTAKCKHIWGALMETQHSG
jgi:hypothetical protein